MNYNINYKNDIFELINNTEWEDRTFVIMSEYDSYRVCLSNDYSFYSRGGSKKIASYLTTSIKFTTIDIIDQPCIIISLVTNEGLIIQLKYNICNIISLMQTDNNYTRVIVEKYSYEL